MLLNKIKVKNIVAYLNNDELKTQIEAQKKMLICDVIPSESESDLEE
jgi:hypothetical protein